MQDWAPPVFIRLHTQNENNTPNKQGAEPTVKGAHVSIKNKLMQKKQK
jgi:hypothetical protein